MHWKFHRIQSHFVHMGNCDIPSLVINWSCNSLSFYRDLNIPWSGTSVGLMIRRICSIDCRSGESPSCQKQKLSTQYRKECIDVYTPPKELTFLAQTLLLEVVSLSSDHKTHILGKRPKLCNLHRNGVVWHSLPLTSMTAKDLFVQNRCYRQTVETIGERFPQTDIVPPFTWWDGKQIKWQLSKDSTSKSKKHTRSQLLVYIHSS